MPEGVAVFINSQLGDLANLFVEARDNVMCRKSSPSFVSVFRVSCPSRHLHLKSIDVNTVVSVACEIWKNFQ
jgi:hypothetical protein